MEAKFGGGAALLVAGTLLLAACGGGSLGGVTTTTAREPEAQEPDTAEVVFVVAAEAGRYVDDGDLGASVVLTGVDDQVVWVSQSPERRTGAFDIAVLVESWAPWGFAADPPNAAVVTDARAQDPEEDGGDVLLVELVEPLLDSTGLTFTARPLDGEPSEGLAGFSDRADRSLPSDLVDARVFIDSPALPVPREPEVELVNDLEGAEGEAGPSVIVSDPRPGGPAESVVRAGDRAELGPVLSLVVALAVPTPGERAGRRQDTGRPEREAWIVTFPGGASEYELRVSQLVDPFADPPPGVEVRKRCWTEARGNFDC